MIKHIVMWTLHPENHQQRRDEFKSLLEGMRGKTRGLISLQVGYDFSDTEWSCDLVLVSEFEDRPALDEYQQHPDHQSLKHTVAEWIKDRHIVDYEC